MVSKIFYWRTPYDKLPKIYTNCSGHMTKMADMPIYTKKTFNHLLENQQTHYLGVGM